MQVLKAPAEVQAWARQQAREGKRIGLVPTMGYLHEGHLSLLRKARSLCDSLVMTLFVNPSQFGPGEDLDRYPRDEDGDLSKAMACGVDLVFMPAAADMYPKGFQTKVSLGALTEPMCGASRPGHFDGVATVVSKLFLITRPDLAVFGQKDFQQLAVIRRLVSDLNFGIEIIAGPIVREEDGVAMSSRNVYLSPDARKQARCLVRGLRAAEQRLAEGTRDASTLLAAARAVIGAAPLAKLDYLELRDAETLESVRTVSKPAVLAVAAKFGHTRLIDNLVLQA